MFTFQLRNQTIGISNGEWAIGRLMAMLGLLIASQQGTAQAEARDLTPVQVTEVSSDEMMTVQLPDGSSESVILIGVDVDETRDRRAGTLCTRPRTSRRTQELASGRIAWLELDSEPRDRSGRMEAYVWIAEDDGQQWMLNERLAAEGYARMLFTPPNVKYVERLSSATQSARDQNLGLWGPCPGSPSSNLDSALARSGQDPPVPRPTASEKASNAIRTSRFNPDRYINRGDGYDCSDFKSQADAQAVLRAAPNDPNLLDLDRDGIACELIAGPYDLEPVIR